MLLDWFTIGAQALNFLILVWLMKRYLYKPILNAIDAREKLIAKELADAEAKKSEALKERDEFQKKNEEFDQQRAALLTKATDEAKAERLRLREEARQAADALSAKRQESLINDAHNLNQAISQLTQKEVFAITRRALGDLATVSLEERMGEVFDRRLRELNGPAKNVLGDALKKNSEPALIRSTFDLPAAQRAAIQNALNETFSAEIHIRFETSPELVSGIELSANGQKVGWSIAEYLASLENGVGKLLKEKDKPAPKPEDKSTPKAETSAEPRSVPVPPHETEAKAKVKPKVEAAPTPEVKPEPKPEVKVEPKAATSKPEVKPATKPEVNPKGKPATESGTKTEIKVGPESGALTKEPSALTPQMFKKVHEFYEELGRADVQAVQAWENTEKENRKGEEKATTEAKPNIEAVPSPETTEKPETETKAEIKTEPKAELKAEEQHADPKS